MNAAMGKTDDPAGTGLPRGHRDRPCADDLGDDGVLPDEHGHDAECLMVQGELFLDDLLLQEGDYQVAPAGTGHRITKTDTGVVIYAHGDLDLKFVA